MDDNKEKVWDKPTKTKVAVVIVIVAVLTACTLIALALMAPTLTTIPLVMLSAIVLSMAASSITLAIRNKGERCKRKSRFESRHWKE